MWSILSQDEEKSAEILFRLTHRTSSGVESRGAIAQARVVLVHLPPVLDIADIYISSRTIITEAHTMAEQDVVPASQVSAGFRCGRFGRLDRGGSNSSEDKRHMLSC